MIRWLLKIFFGKELRGILDEAKKIVEESKKILNKEYITYERIDPRSDVFLMGIQPVLDNKYVISWLNEHKMQCNELIKMSMVSGDEKKIMMCLSQMSMLESLLLDINDFKNRYDKMLNQKKEEQYERTAGV